MEEKHKHSNGGLYEYIHHLSYKQYVLKEALRMHRCSVVALSIVGAIRIVIGGVKRTICHLLISAFVIH